MKKLTHRKIIDGWTPHTNEEISTYIAKGLWRNLTICDMLDRNAEIFPDKLALVDGIREVTWRHLQTKVNRMALHLKRLGVQYGDFFVLQLANVMEFFYFFFALNRIGAVPVMGLARHRMVEINHVLNLNRAKGICVMVGEKFDYVRMVEEMKDQHPYLKLFVAAGGEVPDGWLSVDKLMQQEIENDYPVDYLGQFKPDPNDICCEQLSGGATGLPKGIPITHNHYIGNWYAYAGVGGYTDESISLIAIPVPHSAALMTLTGPTLVLGGTIVLTKSPRPKEHFELIQKYGVTHTTLIPVQITYWKEANELRKNYNLSSLRVMGTGSQRVRSELIEWCLTDLGIDMVNHFGMSEGVMICNRWNCPKEAQMNTIGFPMIMDPEVQVKVVNDKNEEILTGEIGEMVIKGPLNFRGYFRNPEENKRAFDEKGFFHTGDSVSRRPDGRFVVEGRKKDIIIRGGENVYPEAVEDLLTRHPKLMNAAVVGMPDYNLGERLCAFIQPKEGQSITFDEVQQYMRDLGIAVFSWPERVVIVHGWPLIGANKIDKRRLRAYIATKLFEEGVIKKEFCDEYLKRDNLTVDDVLSGRIRIEFTVTTA